jgi:hypothetical protein
MHACMADAEHKMCIEQVCICDNRSGQLAGGADFCSRSVTDWASRQSSF